jgi:hypothetical protein
MSPVRKVDIAHSGQTVPEAIEQLTVEIKDAHRGGDRILLVVHGFGASGVGGAIKEALGVELPGLARRYGFRAYGHADKERLVRREGFDVRGLNAGSTLLVFPEVAIDRESRQDFRPNFRNLRSKVTITSHDSASGQVAGTCRHAKRKLVSLGPGGSTYRCRKCGKLFLVPSSG